MSEYTKKGTNLLCQLSLNVSNEFTLMSCFPSYRDREPFIAPAVALLNSHMADFDTAEVLLLRPLPDF